MVAGFHSEYSGMKFGMFFVGEYLGVILISSMITVLFFGGWLGSVAAPDRLVPDQDVRFYLFLHSVAGFAPAAAFRPVDVLGLESDASIGAPESVVTGAVVVAWR